MTIDHQPPRWEAGWEVLFPASSPDELLVALVARDLVHGSSFDVETEDGDLALDYLAGDEFEEGVYRLLVTAEASREAAALVQEITEQLLDQLVEEAEDLIRGREDLGSTALSELEFVIVPEDEERWDLVVPDWLAPDGAEVPNGFRPVRREDGEPWPSDAELDRHGRVVAVPFDGELHLVAIPAPTDDDISSGGEGELPVVP